MYKTDPISFMDYPAEMIVRLINLTYEVSSEMKPLGGDGSDG